MGRTKGKTITDNTEDTKMMIKIKDTRIMIMAYENMSNTDERWRYDSGDLCEYWRSEKEYENGDEDRNTAIVTFC